MADATLLARIDALETAHTALQREVVDLRAQLAASHAGGFRSIRDSRRCPACGAGSLLHIRRMKELAHGNTSVDMAIVQEWAFFGVKPHGRFELFVCKSCGLAEWHAIDFDGVTPDGKDIVAIEPEPDSSKTGPFR